MTNAESTPRSRPIGRAYVLLTLTALCWGANTVLGRLAVGQVSPMVLVALRWLVVSILLLTFARRSLREDWHVLRPRLRFVCALGVFGFTGFNGFYYSAAHFTTAVNMGIVQGSIPLFVVIGALVVDRTPIKPSRALGVVLGLLGVAIVASAGDLSRLLALAINPGDGLMLAACVFYAGYTVALRRGPEVSALGLLTVMAGAAFLSSLPLAAVEWAMGNFRSPTLMGWSIVLVIAVFPSLLAQLWFIWGVRVIGPGRAGVFVNLVPVFAAILSVAVLSESFQAFHAVALSLVLGGIWLSESGA